MNNKLSLLAIAAASTLALTACGGGGGGDGGSSSTGTTTDGTTSTQTVTGTVSTPQYGGTSAQLAAFTTLNQYRTQCGFPALQENTFLDQSAAAHAKYMGLNNTITDFEASTNPGFTGVTQSDRAKVAGFPATQNGTGGNAGQTATAGSLTDAQYGQDMLNALLAGVYHSAGLMYPVNTIGIGIYTTQSTTSGITYSTQWGSFVLLNPQSQTLSQTPITFPCNGVSGVPYMSTGENPTPPNVSASGWGTPVVLMGNSSDSIVLQSGTMSPTSSSSTVISLQLLDSARDSNKWIQPYMAVAYPASPLSPNTTYSVSINGTVNGAPFSRNFTFTTGNVVG
ncbi:CAP domain-containing protein [Ralstonia solanacearum]|uniref:CAP domain-containing protein n=1 Tax=Ralstonia solanacearum TaxID=305 RepID=UPI0005C60552|nr:CAP domain-containing protein [Ralstonia solanacearum]MBB6592754.1 CAP domain-containing protein [Ralstonia solanacearum]MBB6596976.1 CAP domain-containing protein [Ralstonia solanacearum]MDB0541220.1 CAP domain-containing protein [Ralstonia solanacearum]MDB0551406.1 CAP domain-containing protein [Ralstonia solanacearum]MDB0556169.1 CAP domain-containing protein [Ralstonia solanacearum]